MMFDLAMPRFGSNGLVRPDVCRPEIVARRAASSAFADANPISSIGHVIAGAGRSSIAPLARRDVCCERGRREQQKAE